MKRISIEQAMNLKFPESVSLIVTANTNPGGKPNIMPLGWIMSCSFEPPMVALAVATARYTHELLCQSPRFVVAFAGEGQADLIRQTGLCTGRKVDKFEKLKIPHEIGPETKCPLLTEAAFNLECEVADSLRTGDHTVFVARIVAAYVPDVPVRKIESFGGDRFAPALPA
jgi:flavin reductase (DIM6/NTAB) family NADH-FMN oxidoreductase RutF